MHRSAVPLIASLLVVLAGCSHNNDLTEVALPEPFPDQDYERVLGATIDGETWPEAFLGGDVGYTAVFGDLDGDGDPDCVAARHGSLRVLFNEGVPGAPDWRFGDGGERIGSADRNRPALVDLDGDGDLDLLLGRSYHDLDLYRNTGGPEAPDFAYDEDASLEFGDRRGLSPAFGDLDADGDPDLVLGSREGLVEYHENTGTAEAPAFTEDGVLLAALGAERYVTPCLADLDADGDLDLVLAPADGALQTLLNTGDATAPAWTADGLLDAHAATARDGFALRALDVDADGDPDFVASERDGRCRLLRNVGTAAAGEWTDEPFHVLRTLDYGSTLRLAAGDVDADGDPDLLVGALGLWLLRNVGTAAAPAWEREPEPVIPPGAYPLAPLLHDDDADGDLDLFVNGYGYFIARFENAGTPAAHDWRLEEADFLGLGPASSQAISFGDLDGDGDADLFLHQRTTSETLIRFFTNTGSAGAPVYEEDADAAVDVARVQDYSIDHALADYDGDGDLDFAIGSSGRRPIELLLNEGDASTPVWRWELNEFLELDVSGMSASAPLFVDLDGDGDLDLLCGQSDGGLSCWENVTER